MRARGLGGLFKWLLKQDLATGSKFDRPNHNARFSLNFSLVRSNKIQSAANRQELTPFIINFLFLLTLTFV